MTKKQHARWLEVTRLVSAAMLLVALLKKLPNGVQFRLVERMSFHLTQLALHIIGAPISGVQFDLDCDRVKKFAIRVTAAFTAPQHGVSVLLPSAGTAKVVSPDTCVGDCGDRTATVPDHAPQANTPGSITKKASLPFRLVDQSGDKAA